jgi:ActR/RegA family two-component response regulator
MSERILFIDDEKFVLETFRRNLRKHFEIETAEGPMSALKLMESSGPIAVVVSDLKMPNMNGVELLGVIRQRWPDTVRIMLTGHADIDTAVSAVNKGAIFRFLTKPCAPDALLAAVTDGLQQYRLVIAERQLLHGTLRGCIQVLSEMLALVSPGAFGRAEKGKNLVGAMVQILGLDGGWRFELAAMLSQVGCVALPREILERKISGQELSAEELKIFFMHPTIAGNLLRHIPRLEGVVEIVAEHELPLVENPCIGARILKVALDFTDLETSGLEAREALERMRSKPGSYDVRVLNALLEVIRHRQLSEVRSLAIHELREGMLLMEPVVSGKGAVLMDRGQTITFTTLERFRNFGAMLGVQEPIYVLADKESSSDDTSA